MDIINSQQKQSDKICREITENRNYLQPPGAIPSAHRMKEAECIVSRAPQIHGRRNYRERWEIWGGSPIVAYRSPNFAHRVFLSGPCPCSIRCASSWCPVSSPPPPPGINGFRALSRVLTILNDSAGQTLDRYELDHGLQTCGVALPPAEVALLVQAFRSGPGERVALRDFLDVVRGRGTQGCHRQRRLDQPPPPS